MSQGTATPSVRLLPRVAWAPVSGVAVLVAAFLMAVAGRYGPHRDELYFVAAGHHLAWGYPDQPPLTPLIAAFADTVAPGSLLALRLPSALAAAGIVILSSLTARELGGTSAAQVLMAVVAGTGVGTLVIGHFLSTTTLDVAFWALIVLLVLRALGREQPRWWLAAGLVAGVSLENKQLVVFLLGGLAVGLGLTPAARHHLRSRWLWWGVLVAFLLCLPNLMWQATNGWPELTISADINDEYRGLGERIFYVVQQFVFLSPLAGVLWLFGLVQLLRRERFAWARPVAVAYLAIFVVFLASGGKGYYVAGILPALAAAGCVVLAERWSTRRLVGAGAALALFACVAWPAAVPLLPPRTFAGSVYSFIGEEQLETIGWPAFVATISGVLESLPPAEGAAAVVYTENYGEAGALAYYRLGTPVYSGHNGWRAWGPPPDGAGPVVVVGRADPSAEFTGCRQTATIDNTLDVDNEEQGKPVWLCDAPRGGWSGAWPDLEHLDG